MKKLFTISFLLLVGSYGFGQDYNLKDSDDNQLYPNDSSSQKNIRPEQIYIKHKKKNDTITDQQCAIYGVFNQRRSGIGTNGSGQDIVVVNIESKQSYIFNVKPKSSFKKENPFYYKLPMGTYEIVSYHYWYANAIGVEVGRKEQIYENLDVTSPAVRSKIKKGEITAAKRFYFTLKPNCVNNIGYWDFSKGIVTFSDNKADVIETLNQLKIDVKADSLVTSIPNTIKN